MLVGFDTCIRKPVNLNTTTDATGYFEFKNITAGTYVLSESLKPGWLPTLPPAQPVTVPPDSTTIRKDFGNKKGR